MWSVGAFSAADITRRKMGRDEVTDPSLLRGAIYRQKGNWLATLIALLLQARRISQLCTGRACTVSRRTTRVT